MNHKFPNDNRPLNLLKFSILLCKGRYFCRIAKRLRMKICRRKPWNHTIFPLLASVGRKRPLFLDMQPCGAENGPPFLDLQPCGAENGHRFLTCNPAAQKKSIIFGRATLRRRKNPLFLDMQPCGAEKIHYFWTCNPPAQKKSIFFDAWCSEVKNPLWILTNYSRG